MGTADGPPARQPFTNENAIHTLWQMAAFLGNHRLYAEIDAQVRLSRKIIGYAVLKEGKFTASASGVSVTTTQKMPDNTQEISSKKK